MDKMTAKFKERALFFPQYATTKEMKMTHYHDMLRTEILENMSDLSDRTLSSFVEAAKERQLSWRPNNERGNKSRL